MIWEFYKWEDKHGKSSTALDINFGGRGRSFVFCNNPRKQRVCKCQKCGTAIPREVPRIKFDASYYYGSGYYCLSCGVRKLEAKQDTFKEALKTIQAEIGNLDEIINIADQIMQDEDEFYSKKMALGRLIQVTTGKDT